MSFNFGGGGFAPGNFDPKAFAGVAEAMKKKAAEAAAKKVTNAELRKSDDLDTRLSGIDNASSPELIKDIRSGAQFGEAIIGPEGLGRLSQDENLATAEAGLLERSKGMSSAQSLALREQGLSGIDQATAQASRQAQAQLARSGVKGGRAGAVLGGIQQQGIQSKAGLEQSLAASQDQAQRQGLLDLSGAAGGRAQFDIGQAAKEKNIELQSGLGFAGIGATERGAKLSAAAIEAQPQSSGGGK
jgi:hypothetical protein